MPEEPPGLEGNWIDPGGGETAVLFTTNPGLEDIVADEFGSRLAEAGFQAPQFDLEPFGFKGHVLALVPVGAGAQGAGPGGSGAGLWDLALELRSVHHVVRLLYSFEIPAGTAAAGAPSASAEASLAAIHAEVAGRGAPGMEKARTFRVTTKRSGDHPFTSVDVQRRAGAALVERYGAAVDLTGFDCNVRVDLFGSICVVGLQMTRSPLSDRRMRPFSPRTSLRPNVAFALVHLARLQEDGGPLLDPFCGSGTILREASQCFPGMELSGSDYSGKVIAGVTNNLEMLVASGEVETAPVRRAQDGGGVRQQPLPGDRDKPAVRGTTGPRHGFRLVLPALSQAGGRGAASGRAARPDRLEAGRHRPRQPRTPAVQESSRPRRRDRGHLSACLRAGTQGPVAAGGRPCGIFAVLAQRDGIAR